MKVIKFMQIKMVEIMKITMLLMLIKVEAEIDGVDVSKREQVSFGEERKENHVKKKKKRKGQLLPLSSFWRKCSFNP